MASQNNSMPRHSISERDDLALRRWVFNLRIAGATFDAIAEMAKASPIRTEAGHFSPAGGLGRSIGISTLRRKYRETLTEHAEDLRDDVENHRALMVARYDRQIMRLADLLERWSEVDPDTGLPRKNNAAERLAAENTLLRNLDGQRKMLGLDAPVKVEASVDVVQHDAAALELAAMLEAGDPKKAKKRKKKARR